MEFRILGPLQVLEQGGELPLGPAKERAVLGVLLLHAGSVVSRIQLVDCLWGERAPLTAEKALNNYVSQLRQTLSQAGAKLIETKAPGYVLTPGADALDVTRFHRLATAARERERAGELEAAAAVMKDALEVWRGSALAGVELEGEGRHDVARLEELRLLAQSDLVDYKLGLGRHEELVAELERLVAQHPLDERVQGQFILALYRSGRQADALQAYRATRETLIDTLGIEPSAPLQRLERAILNHDPSLEAPAGVASQPRAWRKGTLPVPTNSLLGRRRELKQLADLLTGPGRLVTITGAPAVAARPASLLRRRRRSLTRSPRAHRSSHSPRCGTSATSRLQLLLLSAFATSTSLASGRRCWCSTTSSILSLPRRWSVRCSPLHHG